MSNESSQKRFTPTWTFTSKSRGEEAPKFEITTLNLTDALMWFHADRQVQKGLTRDEYAIVEIVSDHPKAAQHYDKYDLPPRNPDMRECVWSKSLANAHAEKLKELSLEVKVAA